MRHLPHCSDTEEKLLGSFIMCLPAQRTELSWRIKPPLFFDPFCRWVWEAIIDVVSMDHTDLAMWRAIFAAADRPLLQSSLGLELALLTDERNGMARPGVGPEYVTFLVTKLKDLCESRSKIVNAYQEFERIYKEERSREI